MCPICEVETYRRLLRRHVRNKTTGQTVSYICQKCAAKLHFGVLTEWELYVPFNELVIEGRKFQVKKGKVE